jgi:hypothetical protein
MSAARCFWVTVVWADFPPALAAGLIPMVLSLSCQVGISPRKESRPVDKDKADQSETRDYYADSASRAITKRAMAV